MDMNEELKVNDRKINRLIWGVSILIPVAVGILLTPGLIPPVSLGFDALVLPKLNAGINSTVSLLLVVGYILVRRKQYDWHRRVMLSAFGLSAIFLVSYVLYHLSVGHTVYCEEGLVSKTAYYATLISHILLSVFIIPLASFSIFRGLTGKYERHRKIAKITLPLWLYVSVTGVLVYVFMSPCY